MTNNAVLQTAALVGDRRLTDLLSATKFEVRQPPTFLDRQNHLLFVSEAVLPQQAGRLEFQLRTTLTPVKRRRAATGGGGVQWSQPEVRFDVTDAKQASRQFLPELMTQLLPDEVWYERFVFVLFLTILSFHSFWLSQSGFFFLFFIWV